ncbi:MAG: DUF3137 domain-containing protein [Bacteroidia bacterium]|nr:DUF3137 domain-containing protein [Bacteroidia bacterium]
MKTLNEFRQFFSEQLSRELAAAESARKGTITRAIVVWVVAVPMAALAIWATSSWMGKEYLVPLIILNALIFFFLAYMLWREILSSRKFYNLFKGRVIEGIVRFVDERLHYIPHRYISASTFVKSRLFGKPVHKYEGDDYCFLQLENGSFLEFSEVHALTQVREGGQKRYEPVFEGLFSHVRCPEARVGDIYILPKGLSEADLYQPGRLQTFTTENTAFDQHFTVYANSGAAVRRYLTPELIRGFMEFRERHPDRMIYYASHGSEVYLGLTAPSHLFEPNVWESLGDVKSLEQFFLDLSELMSLLHVAADLSGEPVKTEAPQPA